MRQELEDLLERWPLANDLELTPNSTVIIVGAYKGITADLINQMYAPRLIRCYEPQDWAFKVLMEVAMASNNIEGFNYGLGESMGILPMGEWNTDACSFINVGPGSREQGFGTIVPADWAFEDLEKVDFMMINVEGYEFRLLPYLRQAGLMPRIGSLAVQWHLDLVPEYTRDEMDAEIDRLLVQDDFVLRRDDRPAWIYMTKVHS